MNPVISSKINAILAEKIMGWSVCVDISCPGCDNPICLMEDQHWMVKRLDLEWTPFSVLADAFEVVDRIVGDQDDFSFELRILSGRTAPGRVWAKFKRRYDYKEFEGYANSVQEAICYAAMKARDIEILVETEP